MQHNAVSAATMHVAAATQQVAGAIRAAAEPDPEIRGYQAELRNCFRSLPGLALAMSLCKVRGDDGWIGLANMTRKVPEDYLAEARTLSRLSRPVWFVSCPCGARVFVGQELVECEGCTRFYFQGADSERSVFAMLLPEQDWSCDCGRKVCVWCHPPGGESDG